MIGREFKLFADGLQLNVNGYQDACQTASNLLRTGQASDVHIVIEYKITEEPAKTEW